MKLLFHIGQPKTGSTALQKSLHRNRNILLSYGYLYPDASPRYNHASLITKVFDQSRWPRELLNIAEKNDDFLGSNSRKILDQISTALKGNSIHTIVLSSEYFHRTLNESEESLFRKIILKHAAEVRFVYYVRHPISHFISKSLQWVRYSSTLPVVPSSWFRSTIENYSNLGVVEVIPYERHGMYRGDIAADFACRFLSEDIASKLDIDYPDNDGVNAAIPVEVAGIIQRYRQLIHPDEDNIFYREDDQLRELLVMVASNQSLDSKPRLNPAVINEIFEASKNELTWLKNKYGIDFHNKWEPENLVEGKRMETSSSIDTTFQVDYKAQRDILIFSIYNLLSQRNK